MDDYVSTSIRIPLDELVKVKEMALREKTSQNSILNDLIARGLKDKLKEGFGGLKVVNHEMPGYDPKHKGNLANIMGTADVDEEIAKDLDVNELIDSIHTKKGLY